MKLKELLFERYLPPIIAYLVMGFLSYFYSSINNISWIEFLYSIPPIVWQFLVLIFLLWICVIFIKRRMNSKSTYYGSIPRNGWQNVLRKDYFGVKWQVRTPIIDPVLDFDPFNMNRVPVFNVAPTPRCPECETKLVISDHFLWHTWTCPHCNFGKRTWESIYDVRDRVQNIVDREVEIQLEQENSRQFQG
ncbi:hypothetical protein [Methanobacterium formicicum]|uniref:Uncharacterized protein n=1 Tax=Methanobacterium formicicum TaxID=2162 RepID=A0A090I7J0_METFO|nr:hypothetical protein [Methanobacterium formicicum]MBF4475799.1 hypothetical protein [Methanobacterium formicicum]MDH2658710.1 hypothetical protein [Methanobacterium formicicum]CEA13077.1 hypothetical protein DSM1535_0721 [Methanobacterium formicicum]